MIHNNKVYANADGKFVQAVILYIDDVDNRGYLDEEMTQKLETKQDAIDLFLHNRLLAKVIENEYHPSYYEIAGFNGQNLYYLDKNGTFHSINSWDIPL